LPKPFSIEYSGAFFRGLAMQQQQTNFQTLICSLNTSELQTLMLQLSESDASLSDRIVGLIRHLFPRIEVPNAPQWDPKEIEI
jgi:hypothetical protein